MSSVFTEFLSYFTGSLTTLAQNVGQALSDMIQAIFINTSGDTDTLSVFGAVIALFGGIALALGLIRWCVNLIGSWGARHR